MTVTVTVNWRRKGLIYAECGDHGVFAKTQTCSVQDCYDLMPMLAELHSIERHNGNEDWLFMWIEDVGDISWDYPTLSVGDKIIWYD